jgi:hypothetical protein
VGPLDHDRAMRRRAAHADGPMRSSAAGAIDAARADDGVGFGYGGGMAALIVIRAAAAATRPLFMVNLPDRRALPKARGINGAAPP